MHRIKNATVAALFASFVGLQAAPAMAGDKDHDKDHDRRERVEDRWDRREDQRERQAIQRRDVEQRELQRRDIERREIDRRELERREVARRELEGREIARRDAERREELWERRNSRVVRDGYWDPAPYYVRDDRRYSARRLGRNDRIYRGYDDRYYCKRDDGTTGLIIGGIGGGVLGNVIAPGGSKTIGTIIGAGAGALIGRAIDAGDVVCR